MPHGQFAEILGEGGKRLTEADNQTVRTRPYRSRKPCVELACQPRGHGFNAHAEFARRILHVAQLPRRVGIIRIEDKSEQLPGRQQFPHHLELLGPQFQAKIGDARGIFHRADLRLATRPISTGSKPP